MHKLPRLRSLSSTPCRGGCGTERLGNLPRSHSSRGAERGWTQAASLRTALSEPSENIPDHRAWDRGAWVTCSGSSLWSRYGKEPGLRDDVFARPGPGGRADSACPQMPPEERGSCAWCLPAPRSLSTCRSFGLGCPSLFREAPSPGPRRKLALTAQWREALMAHTHSWSTQHLSKPQSQRCLFIVQRLWAWARVGGRQCLHLGCGHCSRCLALWTVPAVSSVLRAMLGTVHRPPRALLPVPGCSAHRGTCKKQVPLEVRNATRNWEPEARNVPPIRVTLTK